MHRSNICFSPDVASGNNVAVDTSAGTGKPDSAERITQAKRAMLTVASLNDKGERGDILRAASSLVSALATAQYKAHAKSIPARSPDKREKLQQFADKLTGDNLADFVSEEACVEAIREIFAAHKALGTKQPLGNRKVYINGAKMDVTVNYTFYRPHLVTVKDAARLGQTISESELMALAQEKAEEFAKELGIEAKG